MYFDKVEVKYASKISFLQFINYSLETFSVLGHCLKGEKNKMKLRHFTILALGCFCSHSCGFPHLADPGNKRGHASKDCGLLRSITTTSIHKTGHSFHIPSTIFAFTVQRSSRVTLKEKSRSLI